MRCMASDQRMSLKHVSRWPRNLLLSREEKVSQKTEVKSSLREWRERDRETGLKPPNRSAESDCWFMLITFSFRPVFSARNWTLVVFPTPVSPTRRTGSMLVTAIATDSSRVEVCRVTENTEWRGGRDGGEEDRGTNTLPTWRPEDLREMAGLWTVEKKAAWSLEMLSVKAISWAMKVLISFTGINLQNISTASWYRISASCWLVGLLEKA